MDLTGQPAMRSYYSGIQCSEKAAEGNNCGEKSSMYSNEIYFSKLQGTIRNDDFWRNSGFKCWNNIAAIRNNVATML